MFCVTNVEIELSYDPRHPTCLAQLSITFDGCFVIHGLRLIQAHSGLYVAMPDECLKEHCRTCGRLQQCDHDFCSVCGQENPMPKRSSKLYKDIAHPLNRACRTMIHDAVVEAYIRAWVRELQCYRRFVRSTSRHSKRLAA